MKKTRLTASLLVLAMSASLLTGCGGSGSASAPAQDTAASAQAPAAAETPAATQAPAAAETPAAAEPLVEPESIAAEASSSAEAPEAAGTVQLTADDAKQIAFDDALVTEQDVVLKRAELDTDDGIPKYEIEFYYDDTEYSYDIDPETGMITDLDTDPMDAEDYAEMEALLQFTEDASYDDAGMIDEDSAFEIAVSYAGVSLDDAYDIQVYLDYDDYLGKEVYEVEFKADSMEYSCDIDPETGEIYDFESETDD